MKNFFKGLFIGLLGILFFASVSLAVTTLSPQQGGTGISTTTVADVGKALTVSSTNPIVYKFTTLSSGSGGFTTTSINQVASTSFNFTTSSDTNVGLSITTSTNSILFSPLWFGTLADGRISSASYWNSIQGIASSTYLTLAASTSLPYLGLGYPALATSSFLGIGYQALASSTYLTVSYPALATSSFLGVSYPALATSSFLGVGYPALATSSFLSVSYPALATSSFLSVSYPALATSSFLGVSYPALATSTFASLGANNTFTGANTFSGTTTLATTTITSSTITYLNSTNVTSTGINFTSGNGTYNANPKSMSFNTSSFEVSGGQDIAIQGKYAYFALGSGHFMIYDISNPMYPTEVGRVSSTLISASSQALLTVSGKYAYVINSKVSGDLSSNLSIIDVSNVSSSQVISYTTTTGRLSGRPVIAGKYLYIPQITGLTIMDISNPVAPTTTAFVSSSEFASASDATNGGGNGQTPALSIQGKYGYYISDSTSTALTIFDLSNPYNIVTTSYYASSTNPLFKDIAVSGNYAYVTSWRAGTATNQRPGLAIFDISSSTAPRLVGNVPNAVTDNLGRIKLAGKYAYVASGVTFNIYDISSSTAPSKVVSFSDTNVSASLNMEISGHYLYYPQFGHFTSQAVFSVFDIGGLDVPQGNIGNLQSDYLNLTGNATINGTVYMGGLNVGPNGAFIQSNFNVSGTSTLATTSVAQLGINTTTPAAPLQVGSKLAGADGGLVNEEAGIYFNDTSVKNINATLGTQYAANPSGTATTTMIGTFNEMNTTAGNTNDLSGAIMIGQYNSYVGNASTTLGLYFGNYSGISFASGVSSTISNAYNFYVTPPTMNSSTINTDYGLYISQQKVFGVGTAYGIYQQGTNDLNVFAGNTTFSATTTLATTTISSSTITNLNTSNLFFTNATGTNINITGLTNAQTTTLQNLTITPIVYATSSVTSTNGLAANNAFVFTNMGGQNVSSTASGTTITAGAGAATTLTSGAGGNAFGARNTNNAGAGGNFTIQAGNGGTAQNATSTNNSGNGGTVAIIAGDAGTTSVNGGTGGSITLTAGRGSSSAGNITITAGSPFASGAGAGNVSINAGAIGTGAGGTVTLKGTLAASSVSADIIFNTAVTRTAGKIVSIQNNGAEQAYIDYAGGIVATASSSQFASTSVNRLTINSSYILNRKVINTSSYAILNTDQYLAVSSSALAVTTTLPLANTVPNGFTITIKDRNGTSATKNIVVSSTAADLIDGAGTKIINSNYAAFDFTSDGVSKWEIH